MCVADHASVTSATAAPRAAAAVSRPPAGGGPESTRQICLCSFVPSNVSAVSVVIARGRGLVACLSSFGFDGSHCCCLCVCRRHACAVAVACRLAARRGRVQHCRVIGMRQSERRRSRPRAAIHPPRRSASAEIDAFQLLHCDCCLVKCSHSRIRAHFLFSVFSRFCTPRRLAFVLFTVRGRLCDPCRGILLVSRAVRSHRANAAPHSYSATFWRRHRIR